MKAKHTKLARLDARPGGVIKTTAKNDVELYKLLNLIEERIHRMMVEALPLVDDINKKHNQYMSQLERYMQDNLLQTMLVNHMYKETVEFIPGEVGNREARLIRSITFEAPLQRIVIKGKIDV